MIEITYWRDANGNIDPASVRVKNFSALSNFVYSVKLTATDEMVIEYAGGKWLPAKG